jgi:hypothetical protein
VQDSSLPKLGKNKERTIFPLKGKPMNHQPFRDWLLSEEKLSSDQIQEMQEHLQSCETCRQTEVAWLEVESTFHNVPHVKPAPGFTNRWQTQLAEYLDRKQKRRGWMIIGFTGLIIISLLVLLVTQLLSLLQAPGAYLAVWFTRLFGMVSIFYTLKDIFSSFSGNIPIYTFIGMFFLVGIISFMSVLWLATYKKFSMARRSV